ncbi:MAG: hypothetical protein RLZZ196_3751 [Bacteroidota bacterium]|jgi:hypothetical protein
MLKNGAQYKWPSDAVFTLNNEQFGLLYNSLTNIVNAPGFQTKVAEAQQTLGIIQLQQIMNDVLEKAVSDGVALEVSNEDTQESSAE